MIEIKSLEFCANNNLDAQLIMLDLNYSLCISCTHYQTKRHACSATGFCNTFVRTSIHVILGFLLYLLLLSPFFEPFSFLIFFFCFAGEWRGVKMIPSQPLFFANKNQILHFMVNLSLSIIMHLSVGPKAHRSSFDDD